MLKIVEWFRKEVRAYKWRRRARKFDRGYKDAQLALGNGSATAAYLIRTTETADVLGKFDDYHQGVRAGVYDYEAGICDQVAAGGSEEPLCAVN